MATCREECDRTKRALERTTAYVTELETRLEAMEHLMKGVMEHQCAEHAIVDVASAMAESRNFVMDDIDRVLEETGIEIEDEFSFDWDDWFSADELRL